MRSIGVVTVGRSDYGLYRPILKEVSARAGLHLHLIVAGAHLEPSLGHTVDEIERDGFSIAERIHMLAPGDGPQAIAASMATGIAAFAESYHRSRPDILLLLGDRFEMHSAGLAALPFKIPVAHIHGGELTIGAIDDALRHSLTKLSHLHFVSTNDHARRVRQLGEEPWRITISGAPGLDNLKNIPLLDSTAFEERFGFPLNPAPILVTYHPETLEYESLDLQIEELFAALDVFEEPILFSLPNADTGNQKIRTAIEKFIRRRCQTCLLQNMGTQGYFSAMNAALCMVGNSSSGIIEASSFRLPVVNIGRRQEGRTRALNVIDVPMSRNLIIQAIMQSTSSDFRDSLSNLINPYGDGQASIRIVDRLASESIDSRLLIKQFFDLTV
ncbi:MAG: UDP-N-acetylglucosamine 2-epimerase (hydrolyzing) [Verrucomicrobia bacterium Tous-C9LFEB]|nr:MAG: UDP-N-acetylglucosamine 2-epimerase (hydrolyzing) [Verrucomicrobia bacterium Tous-C9LFEB]